MKKLSLLLVLFALFAALAGTAYAEEAELTKQQAVIKEARRVYYYSLSSAQRESFAGFCGLMTSHQLYHMDINTSVIANDGNRQFDYYKDMEITSGGHYIKAYPATEYTLKDALNAITRNGTKDAYNLLVGFQWTNTDAGHRYGHACIINAILDGTVYFVESFYTSIGGREGNVLQCSIDEFAKFFDDWTVFEGIIDFGTGQYADACETYGTDIYVRTRFESNLRSQPCLVGENDCAVLRDLAPGELLRVSAVCVDPETDMYYYRVEDGERTGYISAGAVSVTRCNGETVSISDVQIPAFVKTGKSLSVFGTVTAGDSDVGSVRVVISNAKGNVVHQARYTQDSFQQNISILNGQLAEKTLPAGFYRVEVYASAACKYVDGVEVETLYAPQKIHTQVLQVGEHPINARVLADLPEPEQTTVPDGWVLENGSWYCYRQGEPCTGWVQELGVRYYLDETGKATTGWAEIDGVKRYFSSTGALCTGWLTTKDGKLYLQEGGGVAVDWQMIGNAKYFFDENGLLVTEGVLTDGDISYEIQPDGRAVKIED